VVFADIDQSILNRLNRHGSYLVVSLSPDGSSRTIAVGPVEAVDAHDTRSISALLAAGDEPPLIVTAVGRSVFPDVLETIRNACPADRALRIFDLIAAENIHDPASLAREGLGNDAPAVHACSVGKMVPVQNLNAAADEPLTVRAEAFNTLYVDGSGWQSRRPDDVGDIIFVDDIGAWMDRKLFVHNLGHSTCAWIARAIDPSIVTIDEAMRHPRIAALTETVMSAASAVVVATHPESFTPADLEQHVDELLRRFRNRALGDTVERVGREVRRKLAHDDRVVGCLLRAAAGSPETVTLLAPVYATALRFGIPGVSQCDDDVALNTSTISVGTVAHDVSGLIRDRSVVEQTVVDAITAARPYTA
jgi:mannitol-1-phosphate 5-dehydrogenase